MELELALVYKIPVTLAFKKDDNTLYSKLVKLWTKSEYTHVEIIIDNKWISSNIDTGVTIRELKPLKDTYTYVKLQDAILVKEDYEYLKTWLEKQNNKGYDLTGIFLSQVLPLRYDDRDKWFCSELVTKILQLLNYKEVYNLYPQMVSPKQLADIYINNKTE